MWGEMDTVIGPGCAFYRQSHGRGSHRDAYVRVMCDLEGRGGNLLGDSGVAAGGSSFGGVHLRCISFRIPPVYRRIPPYTALVIDAL